LFKNWSIERRLLVGTIATGTALAFVVILATFLLLMTSRSATSIVDQNMALSARLSAQQATLMEVHSNFLRLLTAQAAGNAPNVDATVSGLKTVISRIGADLIALKATARKESYAEIDSVDSGLKAYAGTIEVVASMLSLDFASAAGMLTPFEDNYAKLLNSLRKLVEAESRNAQAQAMDTTDIVRASIGVLLALSLGAGLAVWWVQTQTSRAIRSGILTIANATERLAKEDLSQDLGLLIRQDELQSIVAGLIVFRDNIERVRNLMRAQATAQEELVRTQTDALSAQEAAQAQRVSMLISLANDFENQVHTDIVKSGEAAKQLNANAQELTRRMAGNRAASESADAVASNVSENVQSVAAAIEEFSASAKEIARQAEISSASIHQTVEATTAAQARVQVLQESAQQISSIVKLINDIASKTNLLALNATIEAARAGDAGRGFAVVAGEVKALAAQTAKATDEIKSQIDAIQAETAKVFEGMNSVTDLTSEVSTTISIIVDGSVQQEAAIREISHSVNTASSGVGDLRQQVSITREETARADRTSQEATATTQSLGTLIETIDARSKKFVAALRDDAERRSQPRT
jgi:methyl-accepting chemotaxis protein